MSFLDLPIHKLYHCSPTLKKCLNEHKQFYKYVSPLCTMSSKPMNTMIRVYDEKHDSKGIRQIWLRLGSQMEPDKM